MNQKYLDIPQEHHEQYSVYNGDNCQVLPQIPDNSIGFSCYSTPFPLLYTYSDDPRDLGNSKGFDDFFEHYGYVSKEIYRTLEPGRNVSCHLMQVPMMKEKHGVIGLFDFRGMMIRHMIGGLAFSIFEVIEHYKKKSLKYFVEKDIQNYEKTQRIIFQLTKEMESLSKDNFIFHGEVTIWKDPLIEATRTKALGLMHKQLCKDSVMCRSGLPDYIVTFRKPGENKKPIKHPEGLTSYAGKWNDELKKGNLSHNIWRKYASPVWDDIRQTKTLNIEGSRDEKSEQHICPLQLDTIDRLITLYSNPGDIILSPFGGIGSEGYMALKRNRKSISIELKETYYDINIKNHKKVILEKPQMELF